MLVFKFGGASVKDAGGITNLAHVVDQYKNQHLLIVVSAMGKTTNALEALTRAYVDGSENVHELFEDVKQYHYSIMSELFQPSNPVFNEVANTFVEIDWMIEEEPHDDYDFIYDQIVSIGELVSTRIVTALLNQKNLKSQWIDVRGYVHTDNTYREGKVLWNKTSESINKHIPQLMEKGFVVTQGFLGGTSENFTTTLGREGSDYTASIFASCLGAESVTIWKDVPGVLNADPKHFTDTVKFDKLSYNEAIEMTYYGATVIHPKTIKPLQNANIPLLVKPFSDPTASGTIIGENITPVFKKPVIILKQQQALISISAKDYSFISENHLSDIFGKFAANQIKINTMQNSALSFSACVDYKEEWFEKLVSVLNHTYKVRYNTGLSLLTVRHYGDADIKRLTADKTILLEQFSRNTAQVVYK